MLSKRFSHLIRLFAIISLSYISVSCGDGDGPAQVVDPASPAAKVYKLVWADEFDVDGAPNVKNWRMETGYGDNGWGNNEWQLYTDSPDNVRVENGNLVINALCSSADAAPAECNDGATAARTGIITSARINSKDKVEIKYGKIQARIKTPPGKGTWPAFWMLGANFPEQPWPNAGEIDIMEMHQFYSDAKTTHFTVHYCDDSVPGPVPCELNPGWTFFSQFKTFDDVLTDDFHVFEAEWDENRIVGRIDGIPYFNRATDPDSSEEFLNNFFMILNVAVGGTLGGPPNTSTTWPQQMLVDWVRVYKLPTPEIIELTEEDPAGGVKAYREIINSVIFGGDSVVADLTSKAVTPLVGITVLELDYTSANTFFSGGAFTFDRIDLTDYSKIVFSLDTSAFPSFHDINIEMLDNRFTGDGAPGKVSLELSKYPPTPASGNWQTYEIPLTHFDGVNLDNVTSWGFWNPKNKDDQLIAGKLYLDNILIVKEPCTANGVVSFTADSYLGYASTAQVSLADACLANKNKTVVVVVDNGTESIGVSVPVLASGLGIGTVNFGPTSDASSTIAIKEGDVLTASYTDANAAVQTDTASINTPPLAVYSETRVDNVFAYDGITNENTVTAETNVTALEGSVSLQSDFSVPAGGENGFAFDFPDTSGGLLVNGSFEAPDATGARVPCDFNPPSVGTIITGWECINFPFVVTVGDGPVAHEGSQVIEAGVIDAIVRQSVPVNPGDAVDVSAYAMNWNTRPLTGIAIMQLNFLDAGNNVIATSEVLGSADGAQTYTLEGKAGTAVGDWTLMELSGVAPAGTVNAQLFLLHVKGGGTDSSKVYWDDANLTLASSAQQTNDISYFQTLKFGINSAGTLADLEVRMGDASSSVASVFLSDYAPTPGAVAGWEVYEIPLSNFTGVNKTDIRALGFYNASSVVNMNPLYPSYFAITLYFDDVHFALDAPPVQTGVLEDMPIEGVTFATTTQSGITNNLGEFQYLQGEMITFKVGGIVLGSIIGAPVITPVELTGSVNPTDQAATNQLVFLQSIDANQEPSDGITISASTQTEAVGKTLNFKLDSAAFTTAISGPTGLVNIIAPGNAVVSETNAVNNFYQTFPPTGSAANTTISVAPASVDADGIEQSTITVQAKDSSGNNITASAGAVTLSSTGSAIVSDPVVDNTDGTYTATVTNVTAQSVIITGTIAGNPITGNATVNFIGAVDVGNSTVDATSPIEADGIAESIVTVQLIDVNNNNLVKSGGDVDLTVNGSATFRNGTQATQAVDNTDGTYTAYVKNSFAEDVTITATLSGSGQIGTAPISFIVGAASGATTTISAVTSAAVDNSSNTAIWSTITVQAKDTGGNNISVSSGDVVLSIPDSTTAILEEDVTTGTNGLNTITAKDNLDGTYTAYVRNPVIETITIEGTIAGNTITTPKPTVLFGNTVGVASETNIDSTLAPSASAYNEAACDQTVVLDDAVPVGTRQPFEGTISGEVSNLPPVPVNGCVAIVVNFGASPDNGITPYVDDFDARDIDGSQALGVITTAPFFGADFQVFGSEWDGAVDDPAAFKAQYGPFSAPNGGPAFSAIAVGEGQVDSVTDQYINVYSDYNNANQTIYNISTIVFQEPRSQRTGYELIQPGDIGSVWTFSGDYKAPSSCGISQDPSCGGDGLPGTGDDLTSSNDTTAYVFIKTLDPSSGFSQTNFVQYDTTNANPDVWDSFSIEIYLSDSLLAGQILQYGFGTVATEYNDSGVYYDNLSFAPRSVDITGYATLKFAVDTTEVTGNALADMELKMEDANGFTVSVYMIGYLSVPVTDAIASRTWQVYEIPVADFTGGSFDPGIMKSLTFKDFSSTDIQGSGVTPLTGTLYSDDLHFIETPPTP